MKNVERSLLASGLFFFMATSNCECFILVGKKGMTTKPQLCLRFSQLLRALLSSFFVFLSLSSGLKVPNGSLHLEIFQFLNNLWRAKQRGKKNQNQNKTLLQHTAPPAVVHPISFATLRYCQNVLQFLSFWWLLMDPCSDCLLQRGGRRRNCLSRRNLHAVNANRPVCSPPTT